MNRNGPSKKRSDELRRQRAAASTRKTTPTAVRRTVHGADYAPPPVMVRRTAYPSSANSVGTNRSRRHYNVPLTAAGGELRLPALPQFRVGWRVLSLLIVALLGFGAYQLWTAETFRVQAAQISGLERLQARDLNAILGLEDRPSFMLAPQRIEKELQQAFPELTAVTATIELPATVLITVTERTPVLAWRQDGTTILVDAQGMAFPNRYDLDVSALPVVEAQGPPPMIEIPPTPTPLPTPDKNGKVMPPADSDVMVIPPAKRFLTAEMVSAILFLKERAPQNIPINYDPVHGLSWQDGRGWQAVFGDEREMEMKLQVYKALVKRLTAEDTQPVFISVEVPSAPYWRAGRGREVAE